MKNDDSQKKAPERILFVEPFSGISGDMFIAALLDLGLDLARLEEKLRLLHLEGYHLSVSKCSRAGIQAVSFDVHQHGHGDPGHAHHHHRGFRDICALIKTSGLSEWAKLKSVEAFRRLAEAEGKIHGLPPEEVHFHEVGAIDSIVDMVGTVVAIEELMPVRVISTRINVGQGMVHCQHGVYPAPGPATMELLKNIPIYATGDTGELTTPTGAALLVSLAERFGPRPQMKVERIGYGAGSKDLPGAANVLRLTLGEEFPEGFAYPGDGEVAVIEATLDDMNPQMYGYFQEKALAAGALDVFAIPAQMKKNRPGILLSVVCDSNHIDAMAALIFAETSTIGLRYGLAQRKTLHREFLQVKTEYGEVTVKVASAAGQQFHFAPEYESCRLRAQETGAPLKAIMAAATQAFLNKG